MLHRALENERNTRCWGWEGGHASISDKVAELGKEMVSSGNVRSAAQQMVDIMKQEE